jgi:hypothetical protein
LKKLLNGFSFKEVDKLPGQNYNSAENCNLKGGARYGERDGKEVSLRQVRYRADCHQGWQRSGSLLQTAHGEEIIG